MSKKKSKAKKAKKPKVKVKVTELGNGMQTVEMSTSDHDTDLRDVMRNFCEDG